ncbi:MAG: hypothetical protein IJZ88_07980 [Clostridia bacterium]|nr:hypothetical protein [Clostridia bacterium]
MKDFEFDTSELLSNLDKLKAKYSFNFDDEEETAPEIKNEPSPEITDEPVIPEAVEKPTETDTTFVDVSAVKDEPAEEKTAEQDIAVAKEEPDVSDMSWLIDSDEPADEPEQQDEEPVTVAFEEPEIEIQEEPVEVEPIVEKEPEQAEPEVAWYLTMDESETAEEENEEIEPEQEQPEIPVVFEDISSGDEVEGNVEAPIVAESTVDVEEEDDDFADLDDDLVVIRHDATENAEKKEEVSPFYAAFMENSEPNNQKAKAPKAVKSPKPAKPVREPKEPKVKKEKQPKDKKPRKKLVLNIVVAAVLVVALWACVFVTDVVMVSNWSAPIFCAESESYADGSKTYTGIFYQIQVSVNEDGSIERVSLPWFAKGPNGDK